MPYTLNGIGTHYYGRRNVSRVNGTCPHCNRWAVLTSYDTRECFCILFVPIIPLKRYRIQNECGACARHYRSALHTFNEQLRTVVDPLRAAVARSPRQQETQIALARALIDFGMIVEAEKAAIDAVAQLPHDVPLNTLAADLAAARGDFESATPYYRSAAAAAPQDAATRLAFGGNLLDRHLFAEAARELEAARQLAPTHPPVLSLLARSYEAQSRWAEALDLLDRVRSAEPDAAEDEELLTRIRTCKEALGYPLSDEERKAGRSWWPWRRKGRGATPIGQVPIRWRPALLAVGGLTVVIVAGAAAVGYWQQNHVPVWFDNGLGTSVSVSVDGEAFTLPPGPPVQRRLAPGPHAIVVSTARGEVERYEAQVARQPLWHALDSSDFYVYNVSEAHVYRQESVAYSANANLRTHAETFVGFERFRRYSGIDFIFSPPPDSIRASSSTTAVSKTALTVASDVDYNGLATVRYAEGDRQGAERALRKALSFAPCHTGARRNLVSLLRISGRVDESVSEAQSWIGGCPDAGVEAHRAYQDGVLEGGGRAQLVAEYTHRLSERPSDAASHYLLGRVVDDPERSLRQQEEAIRLDPRLAWAHLALAYDLMALERYGEAAATLGQALQIPDHDSDTPYLYAVAAVGAGELDGAARRLVPVRREHADYDAVWNGRWLVTLARRDWAAANRQLQERAADGDKSPRALEALWNRRVELLRAQRLFGQLDPLLASASSPKTQAAIVRFERLMEDGRYAQAAAWFDQELAREASTPAMYRLYAAAGLLLAGDSRAASERLHAAMAEGPPGRDLEGDAFTALAEALAGRGRDEDVLRAARRAHFIRLKDAYFLLGARALAQGDIPRARRLFQTSARACVDLGFPLEAAQRLSSAPHAPVRTAAADPSD
jgi:tetratricopeptide (TPR) repeat protein